MDKIAVHYPGMSLVGFQMDADALALGIGIGKQCVTDFSEWLTAFTTKLIGEKHVADSYAEIRCPVCGQKGIHRNGGSIRCAECNYSMPVFFMGRTITPDLCRQLLTYFYTSKVRGLIDADENRFASVLALDAKFQPTIVEVETYRYTNQEAV